MFRPKTLFVVGAGASAELDFPLGKTLVHNIAHALNFRFKESGINPELSSGNPQFYELIRTHFKDNALSKEHVEASRLLANSLTFANSIDQHLDTHSGNERLVICGKAAIVHQILEAEAGSPLSDEGTTGRPNLTRGKITDSWLGGFARLLFQGVRTSDLDSLFNDIAIICFNYDRCIERFLPYAIASHFQIHLSDAEQITSKLKILHPYGTLGPLPTESGFHGLKFGAPLGANIFEIGNCIKTFTEQVEDKDELAEIRTEVARADSVVFLGFGFLADNMKLLMPDQVNPKFPKVFATTFEASQADRNEIRNDINGLLSGRKGRIPDAAMDKLIATEDIKCCRLFTEFNRSLQQ